MHCLLHVSVTVLEKYKSHAGIDIHTAIHLYNIFTETKTQ